MELTFQAVGLARPAMFSLCSGVSIPYSSAKEIPGALQIQWPDNCPLYLAVCMHDTETGWGLRLHVEAFTLKKI
jgi:hypothetical protein